MAAVLVAVVSAAALTALVLRPDGRSPTGPGGGGTLSGQPAGSATDATDAAGGTELVGSVRLSEQLLEDGADASVDDVAISSGGTVRVAVGRRGTGAGSRPVAWYSVDSSPWASASATNGDRDGAGMTAVTLGADQTAGVVLVGGSISDGGAAGSGRAAVWIMEPPP